MDDAFAAALTAKRVARYGSSASGGSASGGGHGDGGNMEMEEGERADGYGPVLFPLPCCSRHNHQRRREQLRG